MKKIVRSILLITMFSVILLGCNRKDKEEEDNTPTPTTPAQTEGENTDEGANGTINTNVLKEINYFDNQAQVDQDLQAEAQRGYEFEEPLVIVNPYGNSPLTAVAIFSTEEDMEGTITVKGKSTEDDVTGTFPAAVNHIVPIYGLYPADTTEVVMELEDGSTTTLQVTTDLIDLKAEGFEIEMVQEENYDFGDFTFVMGLNDYLYAVDTKGDIRWFFNEGGTLGVIALDNGNLAVPASYTLKTQYYKSGVLEMDLLGKIYREYAIPGGMHHDIVEMPNGNLLVAGDRPSMETVEDYVVEVDRETGEVVWELDMMELIDPQEGGSINRTDEDWFHNNALWYDEPTDTLLLSGRHVDAIVAVNKTEKSLKWILGDPEGWSEEYQQYFFTPQGDDFEWQYAQHEVTMLSNGDIMCLDNGAGRTKTTRMDDRITGDDVYSRAVVYRIDEENMTIEQVWQHGKEEGGLYYSEFVSGAFSLNEDPNNIWITFGASMYDPVEESYDHGPQHMSNTDYIQATHMVQVLNDELVYRLTLDHLTYRSLRLGMYEDVGNFDVTLSGRYVGSMGQTETTNVVFEVKDAEQAENLNLSLDPTKLMVLSQYQADTVDNLQDSYLLLYGEDGTTRSYQLQQNPLENNDEVTVSVNGWISTGGLENANYDIYLVLGGTVYNTGYKLER